MDSTAAATIVTNCFAACRFCLIYFTILLDEHTLIHSNNSYKARMNFCSGHPQAIFHYIHSTLKSSQVWSVIVVQHHEETRKKKMGLVLDEHAFNQRSVREEDCATDRTSSEKFHDSQPLKTTCLHLSLPFTSHTYPDL
jgi:hypothetical protein